MPIRDLNQGTIALDSQIPFGDTPNGCDRRASVSDLLALAVSSATDGLVTQYAAPALNAFSVQVLPPQSGSDVWLQLRPTGDFAAGGIVLPASTTCVDGQEVLVTTTHAVTAFTVGANGASAVNGAPTTLAAGAFMRLRFDGNFSDWNRVG